jgi:hypothetical protein
METGARIKGVVHWVAVTATPWVTFSAWHRKRGQEAMNQIGILPDSRGRVIPDRWISDDGSSCEHCVGGGHLLRDCVWVAEYDTHPWAQTLSALLVRMRETADHCRESGATAVPKAQRDAVGAPVFCRAHSGLCGAPRTNSSAHGSPIGAFFFPKETRPAQTNRCQESPGCLAQTSRARACFPG